MLSYKYMAKNGPMIAFLATVVLILIALIPLLGGLEEFDMVPQAQQAYSEEGNIFSIGLYIAVGLLILAVVVAIILSLLQVASHPKGAMRGLISLGALLVLFIILYAIADAKGSGAVAETVERFQISESTSKMISAGIQLTLLLGIGAVVIAIILEVRNYFKNQ